MNRRSIFAGLLAALPGRAKAPQAAPIGDLISDCREWGEDHPRCNVYVDGVIVAGVYYINFTKGFARTIQPLGDGEVYITRDFGGGTPWEIKKCQRGRIFIGTNGQWREIDIPTNCEPMEWGSGVKLLVKTVYGKIETRPI